MFIYRELQRNIENWLGNLRPRGLILTGVVGCGKTTLIGEVIRSLQKNFEVFEFSGDDLHFREAVKRDTSFISNTIRTKTRERALVFVDEVQKCEEVFDALKVSFDKDHITFIVSGSNPAYLQTVARKRLQRRAETFFLKPLSMPEILSYRGLISSEHAAQFYDILKTWNELAELGFSSPKWEEVRTEVQSFLTYGGLPLAYLAETTEDKLRQIRLVVERGFEPIFVNNSRILEDVEIYLAELHSCEFTYQGIFQRTRLNRREQINSVIDQLLNHGYLCQKKPTLLPGRKRSYLFVNSYIDPGIVTYLSPDVALGQRVEGEIHARLSYWIRSLEIKADLGYYKPYKLDAKGTIKYLRGEVDFILTFGKRTIPLEAKSTTNRADIDTQPLLDFLKEHRHAPFGIVLYAGEAYIDFQKKILFWPYWMV